MNELADVIEENQVKGVIADLMTVETEEGLGSILAS